MSQEIERKFLLVNDSWKEDAELGTLYEQGYLISDSEKSVRARIAGDKGFLTIKSKANEGGFSRAEFEYEIPLDDAKEIFNTLTLPGKIKKTRYKIPTGKHVWEIDVFHEDNDGLITAEIELLSEDEFFEKPQWVGEDVTFDNRYTNGILAKNPYKNWK